MYCVHFSLSYILHATPSSLMWLSWQLLVQEMNYKSSCHVIFLFSSYFFLAGPKILLMTSFSHLVHPNLRTCCLFLPRKINIWKVRHAEIMCVYVPFKFNLNTRTCILSNLYVAVLFITEDENKISKCDSWVSHGGDYVWLTMTGSRRSSVWQKYTDV